MGVSPGDCQVKHAMALLIHIKIFHNVNKYFQCFFAIIHIQVLFLQNPIIVFKKMNDFYYCLKTPYFLAVATEAMLSWRTCADGIAHVMPNYSNLASENLSLKSSEFNIGQILLFVHPYTQNSDYIRYNNSIEKR